MTFLRVLATEIGDPNSYTDEFTLDPVSVNPLTTVWGWIIIAAVIGVAVVAISLKRHAIKAGKNPSWDASAYILLAVIFAAGIGALGTSWAKVSEYEKQTEAFMKSNFDVKEVINEDRMIFAGRGRIPVPVEFNDGTFGTLDAQLHDGYVNYTIVRNSRPR